MVEVVKDSSTKKVIIYTILSFLVIGLILIGAYFISGLFGSGNQDNNILIDFENSIFLIENFCKEKITYPLYNTSNLYDPYVDSIISTTYPLSNDDSSREGETGFFTLNLPVNMGTAFLVNDKIYSSAHVIINCSEIDVEEITRYYLQLYGEYGYNITTPEMVENITNHTIKKEDITKRSLEIFNEIKMENPSINLTLDLVESDVSRSIIEYFGSYNSIELTGGYVLLTSSSGESIYNPELIDKGSSWSGKDYAIFKSPRLKGNLKFGNSKNLKIGDEISVIGYPAAAEISYESMFEQTLTNGIISSIKNTESGEKYYQIDAAVSGGNSGGPVFNKNSEIVGILTVGSTETQGFNFFFPSENIPLALG